MAFLNIILDNESCVYHPGQRLSGRIEYTVINNPERVRGIGVVIKGECETSWYESETTTVNGKKEKVNVEYSGREDYFKTSFFVMGNEHGDSVEIPVGRNVYPITCELPSKIPYSFEGVYGIVRYSIISTVYRTMQTSQPIQSMWFTVVTPLDLNLTSNFNLGSDSNLRYRDPIVITLEKTMGCCCWVSGDVSIDLRSPVSGYCPGQVIPLEITCENNSTSTISDIKVFLRKNVTFKSLTPKMKYKKHTSDVVELSLGKVQSRKSQNWRQYLEVPPLPSSNLKDCGLIKLNYEIVLKCVSGGYHLNKKESRSVSIGTIPLSGYDFSLPVSQNTAVDQMNYAPISKSIQSPTSRPPYSNLNASTPPRDGMYSPPPSYDSVFQQGQVTAGSVHQPINNGNTMDSGIPDVFLSYPAYGFKLPPK